MLIVVGASGGLGSHLVKKMAGDHQIIGTYNNTQPPPDSGARMMHRVDVTDSDSVRRFVREVGGTVERIVLVYMAGISLDGMGHKMKEDIWDRVVQTNLKGCFLMSQAFLPLMREQGWGRIINISSIAGAMGALLNRNRSVEGRADSV